MPQNIFKIYDNRNYFWQWDTGQKLIVLDKTIDEVHFSNRDMAHAIPKDVVTDKDGLRVCQIPDTLLALPKNLVASAYVTDDNANKTLRSVKFAVRQRPIPSDYVVSEDFYIEDFTHRLDIIESIIEDACLVQRFDTLEEAEQWAQESKDVGAVISVNIDSKWVVYTVEEDYSIYPVCDCDEDALIRDITALQELVGESPVADQIKNAIAALNLPNTYEAKGAADKALTEAKLYTDARAKDYDVAGSAAAVQKALNEEITRAKAEEAAITKAIQQVNTRTANIQNEVDELTDLIGDFPSGTDASTVFEYVDKKAEDVEGSIDVKIERAVAKIMDNPDDALNSINELVAWVREYGAPKMTTITLLSDSWVGNTSPYSQAVTVNGVTENSKIDLQPTAELITVLQDAEISLTAENNEGSVTIWAIGDKPTEDYTIQALITEVVVV